MFSLNVSFPPYNSLVTLGFQTIEMWKPISTLFSRCWMAAGFWIPGFWSFLVISYSSASLLHFTCLFWIWVFSDILGMDGILCIVDLGVRRSHLYPRAHFCPALCPFYSNTVLSALPLTLTALFAFQFQFFHAPLKYALSVLFLFKTSAMQLVLNRLPKKVRCGSGPRTSHYKWAFLS